MLQSSRLFPKGCLRLNSGRDVRSYFWLFSCGFFRHVKSKTIHESKIAKYATCTIKSAVQDWGKYFPKNEKIAPLGGDILLEEYISYNHLNTLKLEKNFGV